MTPPLHCRQPAPDRRMDRLVEKERSDWQAPDVSSPKLEHPERWAVAEGLAVRGAGRSGVDGRRRRLLLFGTLIVAAVVVGAAVGVMPGLTHSASSSADAVEDTNCAPAVLPIILQLVGFAVILRSTGLWLWLGLKSPIRAARAPADWATGGAQIAGRLPVDASRVPVLRALAAERAHGVADSPVGGRAGPRRTRHSNKRLLRPAHLGCWG